MDLSIIIVSHNTEKLLEACLTSVYTTLRSVDFSFEVIIVDNGSSDGSIQMVQKKFSRAVLIQNKKNDGFGKANNKGMRKSKGTYILLLNSDTVLTQGSIQELYAFVQNHPNSFVGPKLLNMDGSPQTSCGPFFSLPVVFAILFLKGDVLGITRWSPKTVTPVDWVSGACVLASRNVFFDDLFFDEDIFMYMEEVDLFYRVQKKGLKVYFNPNSVVHHVGSGSSLDKRKTPILNIYRGLRILYKKHYPLWTIPILTGMLQCKAFIGIAIGRISGNRELRDTYEKAIHMV